MIPFSRWAESMVRSEYLFAGLLQVDINHLDVSFQCIHAIYTLERILHQISKRSNSFEIVFWHGT